MELESKADEMSAVDVAADAETPAIIEFERNKADGLLVACFVLGLIAIGYFLSRGGLVVGLVGCLLFRAAYGRAITVQERKVDLAFDHEGLSVPTVFEQKLPWSAITGFALEHGHEGGLELYVEVVEPKSYGPRSRLSLIAWPVFSRGFRLGLDSIACSEAEVEAAFRRFATGARKV